MKDKIIHKETKVEKLTDEQIEKNKSRFTITIVDNRTNKVLMKQDTNSVMGVVNIPAEETKEKCCIQSFCSSTANPATTLKMVENLDRLSREIAAQALSMALFGGDNE